ncbi:MAG: ankyrin repeat domain-containing protein [Simkaniaceae bacterium]|nr:ankyrin repeat domain-containing protein [Simkaniaceae bacterium]
MQSILSLFQTSPSAPDRREESLSFMGHLIFESTFNEGVTPPVFFKCVLMGRIEWIKHCVYNGIDPRTPQGADGLLGLHLSAGKGHQLAVKFFLTQGVDIDSGATTGNTPLILAVVNKQIGIVDFLLHNGANPNIKNKDGKTALHFATLQGDVEYVARLLEGRADLFEENHSHDNALQLAVHTNHLDILCTMLNHIECPEKRQLQLDTLLIKAVRSNQKDMILFLCRAGANVFFRNSEDLSCLTLAARMGNIEIIALLLSHLPDEDIKQNEIDEAFQYATEFGKIEALELLLPLISSPEAHDKDGFTPLMRSIMHNHYETARFLLEKAHCNPNTFNREGYHSLHIAIKYMRTEYIDLLLSHGADTTLRSKAGETPYMLLKLIGIDYPSYAGFRDEFGLQLKRYAQLHGIDQTFSLSDGGSIRGKSYFPFFHFDREEIATLIDPKIMDAFEAYGFSSNIILERAKKGLLTIIPTGIVGHMIYLIIYKDLLFVCNKGYGAQGDDLFEDYRIFKCYHINPDKLNDAILIEMQKINKDKKITVCDFFYTELPLQLSPRGEIEDLSDLFSSQKLKRQTAGNCSIASKKVAIRAAHAALQYEKDALATPESCAIVHVKSKYATQMLRHIAEKKLLTAISDESISPPTDLMEIMHEKCHKRCVKVNALLEEIVLPHLETDCIYREEWEKLYSRLTDLQARISASPLYTDKKTGNR